MRIWCVEIGEPLPVLGDERLVRYGLVLPRLVEQGHEVTWWTSSFVHQTKSQLPPDRRTFEHRGVSIHSIEGPGYARNTSLARLRHHAHFARAWVDTARNSGPVDVILASNPTPDNLRAARTLADHFGAGLVVDVRDNWPGDLLTALPTRVGAGLLRVLFHPYFRWTEAALRRADVVVGCSEAQLGYARTLVDPLDAVEVIHHPYVLPEVDEATHDSLVGRLRDLGVDLDRQLIVFVGTVGKFFDFSEPIAAMRELAPQAQLVIAGDGSGLAHCRELATGLPPDAVVFPGWVNADLVHALLSHATVGIAPYVGIEGVGNKIIEYLAHGLPVVTTLRDEARRLLEDTGTGTGYAPGGYLRAVRTMMDSANRSRDLEGAAATVFEQHFSLDAVAGAFADVLGRAHQRAGGR